MKADTHPEIRRYLAAVDRAASALPGGRRRELVADLGEHIDVALAERPGQLAQILTELGDPEEIAATALREEGAADAPGRRQGSPRAVLVLLTLGSAVSLLDVHEWGTLVGPAVLPALVLTLAGLLAMYLSAWWTTSRKWITVAWLILPHMLLSAIGHAAGWGQPFGVTLDVITVAVRAGTLVWLWRHRVAPEGPGRVRFRLS